MAYKKSKKAVQELIELRMKDSDYADKIIDNIANEFIAQLSWFSFSSERVQEVFAKINNAVDESILNNKIQI